MFTAPDDHMPYIRERERERQRERETDRQRQTDRDRQTDRVHQQSTSRITQLAKGAEYEQQTTTKDTTAMIEVCATETQQTSLGVDRIT